MKAFSLVELLVTTAILGVLATVSIANYSSYRESANDAATRSAVINSRIALTAFEADNVRISSYSVIATFSDITGSCSGNSNINGQIVAVNDTNIGTFMPGYKHTAGVRIRAQTMYNMPTVVNFSLITGYNCKGSRSTLTPAFKKFFGNGQGSRGAFEVPAIQNNFTLGLNCL